MQAAPASPTSLNGDNAKPGWTPGQKSGVIAALVVLVLGLIGVGLLWCRAQRRINNIENGIELGPRETRGRARTRMRTKEKNMGSKGTATWAGVAVRSAGTRSAQANVSTTQQQRRGRDRMGGGRTDPSQGNDRLGVRYQMSGALQGDSNMQLVRVPVGHRPLLPPNQQYLLRMTPAHDDPGP